MQTFHQKKNVMNCVKIYTDILTYILLLLLLLIQKYDQVQL